jgi:hypothetical protein
MISADIDNARFGADFCEGFLGFTGREGCEQNIEFTDAMRIPFLDGEIAEFSHAWESLNEGLSRAGFTGDIDQIEMGMGGAEAQGFAAPVSGDADDADAIPFGRVVFHDAGILAMECAASMR